MAKTNELINTEKLNASLVKIYEGVSDFLGEISAGIERVNERNRQIIELMPEKIYVPEGRYDPDYMIPDETFEDETADKDKPSADTDKAEDTEIEKAPSSVSETAKESEPAKSAITLDDITKVIVTKIKQNRSVNDKIGALVKSYGYKQIRELPEDKYESFLNDLAQL